MLQKLEASGRLFKWVIKLGQFNVNIHLMTTIKGQALANFIVEFTYTSTAEVAGTVDDTEATKGVEVRSNESSALTQKETQ